MLDPLLLAFLASDDPAHLAKALEIVRDWHAHHVEQGRSGPFSWYDMAVGLRALRLAHLIDLILHGRLDPEPPAPVMLLDLWRRHLDELSDPAKLSFGNHGLLQLHGLLALTHALPDLEAARDARRDAVKRMQGLIESQFTVSGVHREHSPDYHFFVGDTLQRMLPAPWYDREDFAFAFDILSRAVDHRRWLVLPDGRTVPVGDSGSGLRRLSAQDGKAAGAGSIGRTLDNGYGIVRSGWDAPAERASMLFFMGAFSSSVHKHADDLSFVWFDHGQDILVDSGKYGYDSNRWRQYVLSTRAHNTVEIDGLSYPIKREYAYGSALRRVEPAGDLWLVEAVVEHRLHGVRHQRIVLFKPLEFLIVVDRLVGEKDHGFCSWFHFAPRIEVAAGPAGGAALSATLADGRRVVAWHASSAGSVERQLVRGQETPQIQGWRSCGYKKMEPAWSAGFTSRGRDVLLASAFLVAEAGSAPSVSLELAGPRLALTRHGSGLCLRTVGAWEPERGQRDIEILGL